MIEQEIEKARKKVSQAKAAYDAAVEELSRLLDEQKRVDASKRISGEDMTFMWKGEAVWDCGNGTVDCEYEATATLKATESGICGPEVRSLQIKTPAFDTTDLYVALEKSLKKKLDVEFEDYCTEDDYYQPVVEDFEAEEHIKDWAKDRGLELVAFEGGGDDHGYEPKRRRYW